MKVLVLGKGGREHAITKALRESPSVAKVYAWPGSQGMADVAEPVMETFEAAQIIKFCKDKGVDLVVIGPEDPLVAGLADRLREQDLLVFGPDRRGAQLEGSKKAAKFFMERYKVPTAPFVEVRTLADVLKAKDQFRPPFVFKADGLAAGKGVFICADETELAKAAKLVFEKKVLGEAGRTAIVEQFQPGYELSFFVLTNGTGYVALPLAQDHKKLGDGDRGPNTGGMGTVAPMVIDPSLYQKIITQVVEPTVFGLNKEGFVYRGVVFIGLMITEQGPQVLEYNVRFGDPETQVLLPLLDGDWGEALLSVARGDLPKLQWKANTATACVVLAAEGYPDKPKKGVPIEGDMTTTATSYFLHAGTSKESGVWQTDGGRVLNAVGIGSSLSEAIAKAYHQASKVSWPGLQKRMDIGKGAITN